MSFDNEQITIDCDGLERKIVVSKKEVVRWIYASYFNIFDKNATIEYNFNRYIKYVAKQKPNTQLSIIKWIIENILSL